MKLSLCDIISSVGESVQAAQHALEESAVKLYFKGFFEQKGETLTPITREVSLPKSPLDGAACKTLNVPVTALCSHKTMTLHQVNINMRLMPCKHNGEIAYRLDPPGAAGEAEREPYTELSLTFSCADPPEGMARLNQESINLL